MILLSFAFAEEANMTGYGFGSGINPDGDSNSSIGYGGYNFKPLGSLQFKVIKNLPASL